MTITHILFDLYGTLVDRQRIQPAYAQQLGRVMAERYGGNPESWADANRRIVADWDSYYADLDLDGDNGLDDLWEGQFRTTRALFRLTKTPEPAVPELTTLARELPYLAASRCEVLYPEVHEVVAQLRAADLVLGVASHTTSLQARGILVGGVIADAFTGPILGPDVTGVFTKNRDYYRAAKLVPETCLVVADAPDGLKGARAAGM
ncbi:MAG TPA: HAD family hydrolase, partial [Phototrophicaceae bacterium]|nr:HAD family hydrolase [Phototrophicaceae bacterium]